MKLQDFAQHAGLSVSHFSELVRDETGQSPMAYFIQLKVRHACRLLDLTDGWGGPQREADARIRRCPDAPSRLDAE